MKKISATIVFLTASVSMYACPVCERAKAKTAFGSISHGPGPGTTLDYIAVWVSIKPNEKNSDHIKNSILNFEQS